MALQRDRVHQPFLVGEEALLQAREEACVLRRRLPAGRGTAGCPSASCTVRSRP